MPILRRILIPVSFSDSHRVIRMRFLLFLLFASILASAFLLLTTNSGLHDQPKKGMLESMARQVTSTNTFPDMVAHDETASRWIRLRSFQIDADAQEPYLNMPGPIEINTAASVQMDGILCSIFAYMTPYRLTRSYLRMCIFIDGHAKSSIEVSNRGSMNIRSIKLSDDVLLEIQKKLRQRKSLRGKKIGASIPAGRQHVVLVVHEEGGLTRYDYVGEVPGLVADVIRLVESRFEGTRGQISNWFVPESEETEGQSGKQQER